MLAPISKAPMARSCPSPRSRVASLAGRFSVAHTQRRRSGTTLRRARAPSAPGGTRLEVLELAPQDASQSLRRELAHHRVELLLHGRRHGHAGRPAGLPGRLEAPLVALLDTVGVLALLGQELRLAPFHQAQLDLLAEPDHLEGEAQVPVGRVEDLDVLVVLFGEQLDVAPAVGDPGVQLRTRRGDGDGRLAHERLHDTYSSIPYHSEVASLP